MHDPAARAQATPKSLKNSRVLTTVCLLAGLVGTYGLYKWLRNAGQHSKAAFWSSDEEPEEADADRPVASSTPTRQLERASGQISYLGYTPIPVRTTTAYPRVRMPETVQPVPVKLPRAAGGMRTPIPAHAAFVEHLRSCFPASGPITVHDDYHLPTANVGRPYRPHIVILSEREGRTILIDVEIDAPYDGCFRQPTHCQSDDDSRDLFFTRRGWIVVRFAEIQVHQQPTACCGLIAQLIARLDSEYQLAATLNLAGPSAAPAWDVLQAQKWERDNYRERYLNISGFDLHEQPEVRPATDVLPVETEIERLVAQTAPLPEPPLPGPLLQVNPDPRHDALRFDADAHQYYINGQPATGVSTLVSRFFPEFDTAYWSARKAQERDCSAEEVASEWAAKAAESSAAGTALHQRIEEFYNYGSTASATSTTDFAHFLAFQHDHAHLVPYRTEWQIYHEELLIAGTVDFVARNDDGTLSIYDWKRSHKVVDINGQPLGNSYQAAEGPLKDLPDCSFSYYSLQQNLYKWLLEARYGCRVRDLNLVVLHPSYDRYHVVPVPELPKHVERILAALRATT